jgi:hypothetical protein
MSTMRDETASRQLSATAVISPYSEGTLDEGGRSAYRDDGADRFAVQRTTVDLFGCQALNFNEDCGRSPVNDLAGKAMESQHYSSDL